MLKEAIICIVIVGVIFGLEFYTQNFTSKTVKEITKILNLYGNKSKKIIAASYDQEITISDNIFKNEGYIFAGLNAADRGRHRVF